MSDKKNKNSKKKIWTILYILLGIACLFCIAAMGIYIMAGRRQEEQTALEHETLLELVAEAETETNDLPETAETETVEKADLPIDFEELQSINPEIYAWIRIPDTTVDYPVLQHDGEDQSYYLKHTIYGEVETAASIYTEWYNSKDFTDPNTIIYGHNMKKGMFHDLRYFAEQEYFDAHEDLYIYMPDKILRYQIFTSYEYDDRHLLASFDFKDEEVYAEYLEEIMNPRSMYVMLREGVELDTQDRIVTLSTCVANKPNNRRLVQAVLVEELEAEYKGVDEVEHEGGTEDGE
ncbi:MAG: class B sortase [Roseburia sp.]|nr:class B sortase [Roseburia sp.]